MNLALTTTTTAAVLFAFVLAACVVSYLLTYKTIKPRHRARVLLLVLLLPVTVTAMVATENPLPALANMAAVLWGHGPNR